MTKLLYYYLLHNVYFSHAKIREPYWHY